MSFELAIELFHHHDLPIFTPGEKVAGRFIMNLKTDTQIITITLKLNGNVEVKAMSDERKYIFGTITPVTMQALITPETYGVPQPYSAGQYIYPFEFFLPLDALGSVEHVDYGVRYFIDVEVQRPWPHLNEQTKFKFYVMSNVDLNVFPALHSPITLTDKKVLGPGKAVEMRIQLPKRGFAPGEKIPFKIDVDNQTDKEIKSIEVRIVQTMKLTCNDGFKNENIKLPLMKYREKLGALQAMRWEDSYPIISTIPVTMSTQLVQIFYNFEFRLNMSFFSTAKLIPVPITIGAVAIRDN